MYFVHRHLHLLFPQLSWGIDTVSFNCLRIEMTINAPRNLKFIRKSGTEMAQRRNAGFPWGNPAPTSIGTQKYQKRQTNGSWTPCAMPFHKKASKKKSAAFAQKRPSVGGNIQGIMYGHRKHLHCSKPFQMENI